MTKIQKLFKNNGKKMFFRLQTKKNSNIQGNATSMSLGKCSLTIRGETELIIEYEDLDTLEIYKGKTYVFIDNWGEVYERTIDEIETIATPHAAKSGKYYYRKGHVNSELDEDALQKKFDLIVLKVEKLHPELSGFGKDFEVVNFDLSSKDLEASILDALFEQKRCMTEPNYS